MKPVFAHLPEQRLRQVSLLTVRGILAAQSPEKFPLDKISRRA
jgi:hypothetical protein